MQDTTIAALLDFFGKLGEVFGNDATIQVRHSNIIHVRNGKTWGVYTFSDVGLTAEELRTMTGGRVGKRET